MESSIELKKHIVLMVGIPGSGKSTLAAKLKESLRA
jgi:predicted kinase